MFTGLIQAIGTVLRADIENDGMRLRIACPELLKQIALDDSIACNGVCITASALHADGFSAFAIPVTLAKTRIGHLQAGARVNLELAMRLGDRFGGHLVQGHVNGTATITQINQTENNWLIEVAFEPALRRYLVLEGSVALDGISLTIAALSAERLTVSIIPHTLANTTLSDRRIGDVLNMEVDVLAKTVESLLRADPSLVQRWQAVCP